MSPTSSFIELNWLARHDKYIFLPPIIFADVPYGGFFHYPQKKEILIGNKYYSTDRGLIVINDVLSEKVEASIAHEWRHLWQCYQGCKFDSFWDFKSSLSYKEQIVQFFLSYPYEYDALLFQLKKAPDDLALEWYEWIIKSRFNGNGVNI